MSSEPGYRVTYYFPFPDKAADAARWLNSQGLSAHLGSTHSKTGRTALHVTLPSGPDALDDHALDELNAQLRRRGGAPAS